MKIVIIIVGIVGFIAYVALRFYLDRNKDIE